MNRRKKKRPSARHKDTEKSGLTQVISQIKSVVSEKCRSWHICLDDMRRDGECITLYGHTRGVTSVCPCCGKRTSSVHTNYSNALLEGTVNKTKAIKRSMFNRANADVLRAKLLYSGLKCDWNYHPNWRRTITCKEKRLAKPLLCQSNWFFLLGWIRQSTKLSEMFAIIRTLVLLLAHYPS